MAKPILVDNKLQRPKLTRLKSHGEYLVGKNGNILLSQHNNIRKNRLARQVHPDPAAPFKSNAVHNNLIH